MKLHLLSGAIQIKTNCLKKLMKALKKSCGRILVVRQFLYMVCCAHHHNIIKSPKRTNPPWTFWYASSKHIPYSNKLPSQFVTNTPYVSPLKNCRTVVRQFLYYGVRVPTTRNNKNSEADIYLLRYFGTLEGTRTPDLLVRSQSLYPAELPARICVALFVLQ